MLAHAGGADELAATILAAAGLVLAWIAVTRLRGRGFGRVPRAVAVGLGVLAPLALVASVLAPTWFGPTVADGPRPRSTASIAFLEPAPGDVVQGEEVAVDLAIEGGRLVAETTTNVTPDTGHVHVYLDGELLSMTYGAEQTLPVADLEPGAHRLLAEFVAADHAPFAPRVTATVTFVKEDA
jgi:Family of unknown function (DUF6130)